MVFLGFLLGAVLAVFLFYHKRKKEDERLKSIIRDSTKNNGQE